MRTSARTRTPFSVALPNSWPGGSCIRPGRSPLIRPNNHRVACKEPCMRADTITRRAFLSATAGAALAAAGATGAARAKHLPVGLELYSVRDELAKDLMGTVRAVAKMGYEVVEFYAPYYQWTPDYARDVRKLLDELNVKCLSTHNNRSNFEGDGLKKAIELNEIIGSKTIVMA